VRGSSADEVVVALRRAYIEPDPHLIDAMVPPIIYDFWPLKLPRYDAKHGTLVMSETSPT
jgi:hypothetical protein